MESSGEQSCRDNACFASLHLPHMPSSLDAQHGPVLPTIQAFVVADIDLPLASAFSEYVLMQRNSLFDSSRIGWCIVGGPSCRDSDLRPYQSGRVARAAATPPTTDAVEFESTPQSKLSS
jgi:hypothetical protein